MRKTPVLNALLAAGVLLALVGCSTASAPHAASTHVAHFTPVVFSGTYDSGKAIIVPKGAHSATVYVVCGGGGSYNLAGVLNKDLAGLDGGCGSGSHSYQLAVAGGETLDLEIRLPAKGSIFVIETRFSADPFVADAVLARECSAMATVESDAFNAEDGYTLGKLSVEQWQQKVSDAGTALRPLLSDKPNSLSAALKTINAALIANGIAPGAFVGPSDYSSATSVVNQMCEDNGDVIGLTGDYGG